MKIVIYGWDEGFNKVQFNKFLRKEYGYNINAAKNIVDDILNETEVCLETNDLVYLTKSLDGFKLKYRIEKENREHRDA